MASIAHPGRALSTALTSILMADDIQPGAAPSYQLCKLLYAFHPIGKKMVDAPITKAQSQERQITVPDSPEEAVREQFKKVWKEVGCDRLIRNTYRLSRVYGLSTITAMMEGLKPSEPLDYPNLWKSRDKLKFNCLDPLNDRRLDGAQPRSQLARFPEDPASHDFRRELQSVARRHHDARGPALHRVHVERLRLCRPVRVSAIR